MKVILNKGEEDRILHGYPWVFNNEVNNFIGSITSGEIVEVVNSEKKFVAYGFFNVSSKIMVRILSLNQDEKIDESFFERRIATAIEHRKTLKFGDTCRLVFAEADFLPGLIVDKYGEYLSCQFLCLGVDKLKDMFVRILLKLMKPKGIYERSDVSVREKEGLPLTKGFLYGEFDPRVIVKENDIKMLVDIAEGQKTGYFLDQKLNRDMLKYYAGGKDVLDCFSHTGGFALHAAKYGANKIVACDISQKACDDIAYNAKLNGFNNIEPVCADVFEFLRRNELKNKFDIIILDPPGFIKKKESIKKGITGYRDINIQALKLIKHGGYLFTFSCSQHMTPDLFMHTIEEACHDANRQVQFLDFRIQSPDHPALLQSEEQLYLKCLVLRVL